MKSPHFEPATETILQAVPGLHASLCILDRLQSTSWRLHSAVSVTLFAMNESLRVDIDKPAFSAMLKAGEIYTVPANVTYRLSSLSESARFLAIRSGTPWDLVKAVADNTARDLFVRPEYAAQIAAADETPDKNFTKYSAGYTRLDILASTDRLRLLVLGLGEFRCVPWHAATLPALPEREFRRRARAAGLPFDHHSVPPFAPPGAGLFLCVRACRSARLIATARAGSASAKGENTGHRLGSEKMGASAAIGGAFSFVRIVPEPWLILSSYGAQVNQAQAATLI